MHIEDYKAATINSAERDAVEYLKTGKIGAELEAAVLAIIDNDAVYDLVALILTDSHKGDMRSKVEEAGFSEWRMERELERSESIAHENRMDARRYEREVRA